MEKGRKDVGAHNCRLNSSLRMGFGWFMDTHNMTHNITQHKILRP